MDSFRLFRIRMRNRLANLIKTAMKYAEYLEVLFLSACIYVIAVFFGAGHGWLTAFFSIALYFVAQEVFGNLREIVKGMLK